MNLKEKSMLFQNASKSNEKLVPLMDTIVYVASLGKEKNKNNNKNS